MRPHRALASTLAAPALTGVALTAPDAARAAAPDDTGYAAGPSGCLVKGTAETSTMNTTHGKVPLGKAGWERRAGRLGQTIVPAGRLGQAIEP
ncbi:hypothetical protein [Streptomyces sp. NPDC021622]|uniref:hypothetical protein n=1 Tax=Streptomyces sp. NPDC021622 TaxID=3155013 RepID=UPI0033D04251